MCTACAGVKLRRQAGLVKQHPHAALRGVPVSAAQRRPVRVSVVTPEGRRAVGRLLIQHKLAQEQEQEQQQPSQSQPELQMQQLLVREQGELPLAMATAVAEAAAGVAGPAAHTSKRAAEGLAAAGSESALAAAAAAAADMTSANAASSDPDAAFVLRLAELQQWRKRHGSCIVPAGVFDKPQLAEWAGQVRAMRRSSSLPAWQAAELDAAGFTWRTSAEDEAWHARLHQLRHFKQLHGHLDVPAVDAVPAAVGTDEAHTQRDDGGEPWAGLAAWLQQQRSAMAIASDVHAVLLQTTLSERESGRALEAPPSRLSVSRVSALRRLGVTVTPSAAPTP
jgi:Helicase associated domain